MSVRVPIKVLQVTEAVGGVETYLVELFGAIDRERFDIRLACRPDMGTLVDAARDLGIPVSEVPFRRSLGLHDIVATRQLLRVVRADPPDLIHGHSSKGGGVARIVSVLTGVPCVYTPHAFAHLSSSHIRGKIYLWIERLLRRATVCLVAGSESERQRAVSDVGYPPTSVRTVWNAIDLDELDKIREVHLNRGESGAPTIVGFVGRLGPQKDPLTFVRAARAIANEFPECRFTMIGAGYLDELGQQVALEVRRLGLEEQFQFEGWMSRTEVLSKMAGFTVLVVPSIYESFGYVAAEAGRLGLPVVATRVDGLKDVIENGVSGFLLSPGDHLGIGQQVLELLKQPSLRALVGEEARERVGCLFSIDSTVQDLEAVYRAYARVGRH